MSLLTDPRGMRGNVRRVAVLAMAAGLAFTSGTSRAADEGPYSPQIAEASNAGEQAISSIKVPVGFHVSLWAAEPMLANPVAFCIDAKGKVYVAETFRQMKGVQDIRAHMVWLDDDLAAVTVEDRLAYLKKHLGERVQAYAKEHDRIRLLEDRDGDGRADHAEVFADGFNGILEGTGAGVLARGGKVWYTNIPSLWLLEDTNGDGKADTRTPLHTGYGVRVSLRGHDLHGLRFGPDGRLYFSIGDRGFNVTTKEATQLVYPDRGAVLRCNPDGTELEVVASGLRNPQELAFDQYGNLFTCDNNSDGGDRARWVYIVEGGDSGWRMYYQYLRDRGPWNREKLWYPHHEGQAAYIVPPIANVADGPSGLTYNPGTGFPARYTGHFFLADFRGTPNLSGIRSFAVKPKGAGFELIEPEQFAWSLLATDVDFGPDGAMYVSDWVEGWDGAGKGRLYRIAADSLAGDAMAAEARRLIGEGFSQRSSYGLSSLLAHPNMMVRIEAQFALASKGADGQEKLAEAAAANPSRLARFHGVWGLGQLARKGQQFALFQLRKLLNDANESDSEVRGQVVKVLGEAHDAASADRFGALTRDSEPRVRFFAAIALGKVGGAARAAPLLDLLRENADRDPYLRHAAIMGLSGLANQKEVLAAAADPSAAVRTGVLLALRRRNSPEVARFLADTEPRLIEEAARAINDVPIEAAQPNLAALAGRGGLTEPTLWRVINANFRLGTLDNAKAVAALAGRADVPAALRIEALEALGRWAAPGGRDRVLGSWRPLPTREPEIAPLAFRSAAASIFSGGDAIRKVAFELAGKLGVTEVGAVLFQSMSDADASPQTRAEAIKALDAQKFEGLAEATRLAIEDPSPLVRTEGRRSLARHDPVGALAALKQVLEAGEVVERQAAFFTLADMQTAEADAVLSAAIDKLKAGALQPETQLDLIDAVTRRGTADLQAKVADAAPASDDPLATYRVALVGGDAERGRRIFFEKSEVSCVRCHKVNEIGGDVGPDLSKIAAEQKRDYLLESIVLPDKQIAKGFDPVVIATDRGKTYSGVIKQDDGKEVRLITAEGNTIIIAKAEIDEQTRGRSSMPEDLVKKLTRAEVRDLLEFLANLK
ncbi:MAG: PVC-type heme-binding CxxCH protein [Planctomycetaceae bacterium]